MGTYLYLTVKTISVVYILYKFWNFMFSRKTDGLWDSLYLRARIIRYIIWRWRKKLKADRLEREKRHGMRNKCAKKEDPKAAPAADCEVIGKTRSVYIPDPKKAKEPVSSEPMPESDFIGEDEDISADDVDDKLEPVTDDELQELMEPGLSEPDSDFSQAMTYEDLNNMVAVASGANKDEADTLRAVETLYSVRLSDIYEFILNESDNKERIERLMRERFEEEGTSHDPPVLQKKETSGFDWSQYV